MTPYVQYKKIYYYHIQHYVPRIFPKAVTFPLSYFHNKPMRVEVPLLFYLKEGNYQSLKNRFSY